jgi:hypothetical protein
MELSKENIEQLKKDFKTAKSYDDLMGKDGAIKKLLKLSIENMLNAELTEHLGNHPAIIQILTKIAYLSNIVRISPSPLQ